MNQKLMHYKRQYFNEKSLHKNNQNAPDDSISSKRREQEVLSGIMLVQKSRQEKKSPPVQKSIRNLSKIQSEGFDNQIATSVLLSERDNAKVVK